MAAEQIGPAQIGPARTNLDSFLRGDDQVNLRENIQARKALEVQERIQLLQARVNVKQLQINTSLQVIKLASDAAPLAEHSPVSPEVIAKANETLLAAMDDAFYALPGEEEIAA